MINAKTKHLIQYNLLNIEKILELLIKHTHCETCFVQEKIENGEYCDGCIYYKGSLKFITKEGKSIYRAACKPSIFKLFGFLTDDHIGRTDVVYFHHHPELNWSMPSIPKYDIFGRETNENTHWELHHYIVHYNDRYVVRVLSTEHPTIEAMARRGDLSLVNILLQTRERHPSLEPGVLMNKQQLKEYYKQNKLIRRVK